MPYDNGYMLVMSNQKIVQHYLAGWFPIDFVSVFPFDLIGDAMGLTGALAPFPPPPPSSASASASAPTSSPERRPRSLPYAPPPTAASLRTAPDRARLTTNRHRRSGNVGGRSVRHCTHSTFGHTRVSSKSKQAIHPESDIWVLAA